MSQLSSGDFGKKLHKNTPQKPCSSSHTDSPEFSGLLSLKHLFITFLPAILILILGVLVFSLPELSGEARFAMFGFGMAVILWSATKLDAALVALACALFLVFSGAVPQERIFEAMASEVIWLMFGAFILGEAVRVSGLANRLMAFVVRRASGVEGLAWLMSAVLVPLAFLIPSTSGRAALMLPVYQAVTHDAAPAVRRALALLIPSVILVSTVASLVGAGSHVLTVDLLRGSTGQSISFGQWALWGLPFALLATAITVFVITRMFLSPSERRQPLLAINSGGLDKEQQKPSLSLSAQERNTLLILVGMVSLWLTEHIHGFEIATIALAGALLLVMPKNKLLNTGVIKWKDALKSVSWNLLLFVGAALMLGKALIETGAAEYLVNQIFSISGLNETTGLFMTLLLLSIITLTSHIYMTSHAARAAALTPPLLLLAAQMNLNPVAVVFIGTVGIDYCLTFLVSSKALLLFGEQEESTFTPADLLRLSTVLLPVHVLLIIITYFLYWRFVGLEL